MKNYKRKLLTTYNSSAELADDLAHKVSRLLQQAVKERNYATLVVSGGNTPKPFFQRLAEKDIDWPRVTVTLADERWVDTDSPNSNEKLVRTYLLQGKAEAASFIGLKNRYATVSKGRQMCSEKLAALLTPFDVVVLGMGTDGHTASFFPQSIHLREALDTTSTEKCIAITSKHGGYERITMTLSQLLDARQIFVYITGEGKMAVLEEALSGESVEEMPIRSILLQDQVPVQIFWAP